MDMSINPNIGQVSNNRPAEKPSSSSNNYTGPAFSENLKKLATGGLPEVNPENNAASLDLKRQKEEFDKLFSFTDAEEELAQEYIAQINKLLNQFKK